MGFKKVIESGSSAMQTLSAKSPFLKSFREGLFGGCVVFLLLFVWMMLRADDTARNMQFMVPAKMVSVETKAVEAIATPETAGAPSQTPLPVGRTITPLPPAPIEGLAENSDGLTLPLIRIQDDLTPFDAYKKPFNAIPGRPRVSFVILDFGLSTKLSQSILDNMPGEVTLVLTGYSDDPKKWGAASRAYGHEFWVSLPMQPKDVNASDNGPETLMKEGDLQNNKQKLLRVLGSATGYAGVVTSQNHAFASDNISASPLLKQIYGRGLAIAESNPDIPAFGLPQAMQDGYPYVQNNFWLDTDLRPEAIDRALRDVELQATRKGKAIAFLRPYPIVIKKLQEWIDQSGEKGIQIAPLSAMTP